MRAQPIIAGLALAFACAACTQRDAANETVATPNTSAAAATNVPPPAIATTVPPSSTTATMPASPSTVAVANAAMPAAGAISFAGFGPAHWGASEEQVRQAWGKDMAPIPKEHDGCYYLFPEPRSADGYRIAFMMEAGKFGRIDVRTPDIAAPGGGKVGMDKAALKALYPGASEMPQKYVEHAVTLRATDPNDGKSALVFQVDPSGKVTDWRIGVPPQVDYVEGCS